MTQKEKRKRFFFFPKVNLKGLGISSKLSKQIRKRLHKTMIDLMIQLDDFSHNEMQVWTNQEISNTMSMTEVRKAYARAEKARRELKDDF